MLEDLALEDNKGDEDEDGNNMDVDGPALTTLEATPAKPKKSKKRKSEDMDVDEEEEEAPSSKKVESTKEEKKALKKAMKAKAKNETAAVVSCLFFLSFVDLQKVYKVLLINRTRSLRKKSGRMRRIKKK